MNSCAKPAVALETPPPGYSADREAIYQNDGGAPDDATSFRRLLAHLHDHVQAVGRDHVEIRVVDHGPGVDLFVRAMADHNLAERIDALKAQGVRFLICADTLRQGERDWHDLREADVVPSGLAEVARLQGLGFACIRPRSPRRICRMQWVQDGEFHVQEGSRHLAELPGRF